MLRIDYMLRNYRDLPLSDQLAMHKLAKAQFADNGFRAIELAECMFGRAVIEAECADRKIPLAEVSRCVGTALSRAGFLPARLGMHKAPGWRCPIGEPKLNAPRRKVEPFEDRVLKALALIESRLTALESKS